MPPKARKGRLILIDAHSLIYRAFFALPPMSTSAGEVTNAVYGFTSMLAIVLAGRPEYAVAAFDMGGPTFRTEEYAEYKAGRRAMPDDLRPQIQRVKEVLESFSIPIYGIPGFEADDIVGTLAKQGEEMGMAVTIVSGDLDCLQCVTDSVDALVPRRGITDTLTYGPAQVRQRYNLEPAQLIDYKALRGDTSDNIPGVPGVGEKTASQLISEFGSIENLLANLDKLKPGRIRDALEANVDRVRLGKRLVTIRRDVDVQLDLEKSRWTRYDADATRRKFDELEFRALLARFPLPDSVQVPLQPTLAFEPVAPAAGVRILSPGSPELAELLARLHQSEEVGVFGLWDGPARGGRMVGLGFGFADEAYYVPIGHENDAANLPIGSVVDDITSNLRGLELLGHDVKEMQLALNGVDEHQYRWGFSSSLAAYLLGAGARDPRLEDLARDFLGMELVPTDQLLGTGRNSRLPSVTEVADAANYTAGRARATYNLRPRLAAEMRELGVDYLFHEVELPLARVLAAMESEGVGIDVPYLAEVAVDLGGQLAAIETEVATLAEETAGVKPRTWVIWQVAGGGVAGGEWLTLTCVFNAEHWPGVMPVDVVCAETMSESLPVSGMKPPVKPALVHAVRACATVCAIRFGTAISVPEQASGALCVTVTVDVKTRQCPGVEDGDVVCVRTVSPSNPVVGVNVPVNPAPVHADRAAATVRPTMFGTSLSEPMQPADIGSDATGIPAISPPNTRNVEVAPIVSGFPTRLPTSGVRTVKSQ